MTIEERVRGFVASAMRGRPPLPDDAIFGSGGLNSLFAMQLILFLEKTFGIHVGDGDLEWRNFETVRAIAAFVGRKLAAPEAAARGC